MLKYLSLFFIVLTVGMYAYGKDKRTSEVNVYDLTIEENIAYPQVPSRLSNTMVRHMDRIRQMFVKHGFVAKSLRKGEVIDIVIPCRRLFLANDTVLMPEASRILNSFNAIVKLPQSYRVLVVVHSDISGSEKYLNELTEKRATAIDDNFSDVMPGVETKIVPYGVGSDEPAASSDSMMGRELNRRVDFIIIPEKAVIDLAKSNKL